MLVERLLLAVVPAVRGGGSDWVLVVITKVEGGIVVGGQVEPLWKATSAR